jgi:predicted nucleic acid-binding protein
VVARPTEQRRGEKLCSVLDVGEAEAIVLALERHADLVLVDERRGRRQATAAGLSVTGLVGVVVAAKRARFIDAVKPLLDDLIVRARFWIGPGLYREVLATLGES